MRKLSLLLVTLWAFFLVGCPLPWNAPYIICSGSISFDLQDTLKVFELWAEEHTGYESYRVKVSKPWIHVTPEVSSITGGNSSIHEVRVDRDMPAGLYYGEINFEVIQGSVPIHDFVKVALLTGTEIRAYEIQKDMTLDSIFWCSDSNLASGQDFWGVSSPESEYASLWCCKRGEHHREQYDNDMDAWMILKPEQAIDVQNFQQVQIGFRLSGSSIYNQDYLELLLITPDGNAQRPKYLPITWSGDWLYEELESVPLTWFGDDSLTSPLRFAFFSIPIALK